MDIDAQFLQERVGVLISHMSFRALSSTRMLAHSVLFEPLFSTDGGMLWKAFSGFLVPHVSSVTHVLG